MHCCSICALQLRLRDLCFDFKQLRQMPSLSHVYDNIKINQGINAHLHVHKAKDRCQKNMGYHSSGINPKCHQMWPSTQKGTFVLPPQLNASRPQPAFASLLRHPSASPFPHRAAVAPLPFALHYRSNLQQHRQPYHQAYLRCPCRGR